MIRLVCCIGLLFCCLPQQTLAAGLAESDQQAANEVFGDEFLSENVKAIRQHAAELPVNEQFDFLARWVLPGDGHGFRMSGDFTPSGAAPPVRTSTAMSPLSGSVLVSPVYDLLDVAVSAGRLAELRDAVESATVVEDAAQQRARISLLALTQLHLQDGDAADASLDQLRSLINGQKPKGLHDQWPETLVVYRGVHLFSSNETMGDLLLLLQQQRTSLGIPQGINQWHLHIEALINRYQFLLEGGARDVLDSVPGRSQWIPTSAKQSHTRGRGNPTARWIRTDTLEMSRLAGHSHDYLFYQSPLRGNFQVDGEIGSPGVCDVYAAGESVGPMWNRKQIQIGTFQPSAVRREPIDPPLARFRNSPSFRAEFLDGRYRLFVNGRLIHETNLDEHSDPWFGFHSRSFGTATPRNIRITGQPEIPDEVVLSGSRQLTGWVPYHGRSVGRNGAHWQHVDVPETGGEIHGLMHGYAPGNAVESMLRYQRPLVEDGSVEYEFFYQTGGNAIHAHPAIDRLAFLLERDGVRIHWVTDDRFDRTDLPPDNRLDEPANRRGPGILPLKAGEWNRVKLAIVANTVTLDLNGQQIYERKIESNNDRSFGLFHFADLSALRVRRVVMRGDWPKTLPSVTDQQLADPTVAEVDAGLSKLQSEFFHDFAADGAPDDLFRWIGHDPKNSFRVTTDGLQIDFLAPKDWRYVAVQPRFELHGDFDFEAKFENLNFDTRRFSSIEIGARIHEDPSLEPRTQRYVGPSQEHFLRNQLLILKAGGGVRTIDVAQDTDNESASGRLRLARRGSTVYSLFAEGDSDQFRLIGQTETSRKEVAFNGINLYAVAGGGGSRARVVWKNVRLRAEKLKHLPGEE